MTGIEEMYLASQTAHKGPFLPQTLEDRFKLRVRVASLNSLYMVEEDSTQTRDYPATFLASGTSTKQRRKMQSETRKTGSRAPTERNENEKKCWAASRPLASQYTSNSKYQWQKKNVARLCL
jgi:hypothetical protein